MAAHDFRERFGIPTAETLKVTYYDKEGSARYVLTSKANAIGEFIAYRIVNGKALKIKKISDPPSFESEYIEPMYSEERKKELN